VSEGMREEVISSGGTIDPAPAARYSSSPLSYFLANFCFLPKLGFCFLWTFANLFSICSVYSTSWGLKFNCTVKYDNTVVFAPPASKLDLSNKKSGLVLFLLRIVYF